MMRPRMSLVAVTLLTLAACGEQHADPDAHAEHGQPMADKAPMQSPLQSAPAIGHASGEIVAIDAAAGRIQLRHGPIDGLGMGAMTMFFEVADTVDLGAHGNGEQVGFSVQRSRDGRYRVLALCAPGQQCIDATPVP